MRARSRNLTPRWGYTLTKAPRGMSMQNGHLGETTHRRTLSGAPLGMSTWVGTSAGMKQKEALINLPSCLVLVVDLQTRGLANWTAQKTRGLRRRCVVWSCYYTTCLRSNPSYNRRCTSIYLHRRHDELEVSKEGTSPSDRTWVTT